MPSLFTLPGPRPGPDNVFAEQRLTTGAHHVVASGTNVYGSQFRLFWADHDHVAEFTNHGTIWNVSSQTVGAILAGFYIDAITNTGTVISEATNGNAYGLGVSSTGSSLFNSGSVWAIANGNAVAIEHWWPDVLITNSGLVAAYAPAMSAGGGGGGAVGLAMYNGGFVDNRASGSILAEGLYATAIIFSRGELIYSGVPGIRNAGRIEARVTDPTHESVAISTAALDVETMVVENSGIIRADIAYISNSEYGYSPPQQPADQIVNLAGGQIYGRIETRLGADRLINSGEIHGNLLMGEGADLVDSSNGLLDGVVRMEWGNDRFIGGAGDDAVMGGRDADWLDGGAGRDLLLGGSADDLIVGGAGNDGLFGEYGNDRLVTQSGDYADAGAGDDIVEVRDLAFASVRGGDGTDRLLLAIGAASLDLAAVQASGRVQGFEIIEMADQQRLVLRAADIVGFTGGGHTLRLFTAASDVVELIGGWAEGSALVVGNDSFRSFTLADETALVAGAGTVTIAAAPSAPAGGLDPVAPGAAAPLPGSIAGVDLSGTTLVLNNYEMHATETIQAEEVWRSDNGRSLVSVSWFEYSLINRGLIESIGSDPNGTRALSVTLIDHVENFGTIRALGSYGTTAIYTASMGGVTNYGLIEAVAASGTATAVALSNAPSDRTNLENYGTISARANATSRAQGAVLTRDDGAINHGVITAAGGDGTTAVSVSEQGGFTNTGTIAATLVAGATGSTTGLFYVPGAANFILVNHGLIQGTKAIDGTRNIYSSGFVYIYNFGRLEGSVTLADSHGRFENWGEIIGDVRLGAGINLWFGADGQHDGVLFAGGGDDMLIGSAAADRMNGEGGDDYLLGGAGADQLSGGDGSDLFVYTAVSDSAAAAFDTISGFVSGVDRIDFSALGVQSVSIQDGGGFTLLSATTAQGTLTLHVNGAVAQSDLILTSSAVITGTAASERLVAAIGGSSLDGGGGGDQLIGGAGSDRLDGGLGNDVMWGGAGDDVYIVDSGGDTVWEVTGQGTDLIEYTAGLGFLDLPDNVENANLHQFAILRGNDLANRLRGSAANDTLSGNDGDDILIGAAGGDTLEGGAGADLMVYLSAADSTASAQDRLRNFRSGEDKIDLRALGPVQIGWVQQTDTMEQLVYNLVTIASAGGTTTIRVDGALAMSDFLLSEPGQQIVGTPDADALAGASGNDIIDGRGGADTMAGGYGNDTYYVDNAGDVVNEAVGQGNDRIATSISYTLLANAEVEQLEAVNSADTGAMDLTGNDFVNLVIGNAGTNLIFAYGGNDTLIGHGGNDFLVGGTGADLMYGGTGNDTFYIDNIGDRAYELAGEGTDRIATTISYTLDDGSEVELLEATNTLATNAMDLTGSSSANQIIGNAGTNLLFGLNGNDQLVGLAGNDFLVGGTGADIMYGGTGDDTYYVDDLGDRANEAAGEGTADRIATSISYTLDSASEVELLEAVNLTATDALNLTGSDSANTISGNGGINLLFGLGGNDVLNGYGGDDFLVGGTGADAMYGGLGNDTYYVDSASDQANELAGQGNDRVATSVSYTLSAEIETLEAVTRADTSALNLTGNGIANTVVGNDGANTLDGKGGNDLLIGYGGADTFAFTSALGAVDHIFDFVSGSDRIALDDAIFGALGAGAFAFGSQAGDADDRIVYDAATGNLYFDADGNGAGAQVLFAVLDGHPPLAASDFIII